MTRVYFPFLLVLLATLNFEAVPQESNEDDIMISTLSMERDESSLGYLRGGDSNNTNSTDNVFIEDENDNFNNETIGSLRNSWQKKMLNLVNDERRWVGAGRLCLNQKLSNAAQAHANDMGRRLFYDHTGSDGSTVGARADRAGYYWLYISENIYFSNQRKKFVHIPSVHNSWMNSRGHANTILDSKYREVGFARTMRNDRRGQYYVQVFGSLGRNGNC